LATLVSPDNAFATQMTAEEEQKPLKDPGESLVFIGGSQRSGTTILQKLVCTADECHPMIGECVFVTEQLNAYNNLLGNFDVWMSDYFGSRENYALFTRNILSRFFDETRKRLSNPATLVLKQPTLTSRFPLLGTWFENARFIVIVRDPRDTIASVIQVNERQKRAGVTQGQVRIGRDIKILSRYFKSYYLNVLDRNNPVRDRTMFVRYEELMKDASKECARIAEFCSLSFNDQKIGNLGEVKTASPYMDPETRKKRTTGAAFWSDLYNKDLSTSRIGTHRQVLTNTEILQVQELCSDFNRAFRYW
jgi:hypothetical protein